VLLRSIVDERIEEAQEGLGRVVFAIQSCVVEKIYDWPYTKERNQKLKLALEKLKEAQELLGDD